MVATTSKEALTWVTKLYARLVTQRAEAASHLDYLEGKHKLVYATDKWSEFHSKRFKDFSDNWCGVVANTPVRRLRVDGIRVGEDLDPLSGDERELQHDWDRNELPTLSKQGFLMSIAAKRSYTITWADEDGDPVVSWETPTDVFVLKDSLSRQTLAVLKSWNDDNLEKECATLYLPDSVWKWQRGRGMRVTVDGRTDSGFYLPTHTTIGAADWEPREEGGEPWPLPNPVGEVMVAEYGNQTVLGRGPLSDIDGTMKMQNAINLMWAYLFAAADYASMPARVVLGAEPPQIPVLDAAGQVASMRPATQEDLINGRMLWVPRQGADGPTPSVGQWDSASLDVFLNTVREAVGHVAAQTSTPGHYLLTNEKFANLNADALTAAEVPLVDKVDGEQMSFTPAVKQTYRHMALVRKKKGLADEIRSGKIQWQNAAMHSVGQIADAATKDRNVGISLATVLRTRYGMSPEEIQRELDAVKAEQHDPFLSALTKDLAPVGTKGTPGVTGNDVSGIGNTGA